MSVAYGHERNPSDISIGWPQDITRIRRCKQKVFCGFRCFFFAIEERDTNRKWRETFNLLDQQ